VACPASSFFNLNFESLEFSSSVGPLAEAGVVRTDELVAGAAAGAAFASEDAAVYAANPLFLRALDVMAVEQQARAECARAVAATEERYVLDRGVPLRVRVQVTVSPLLPSPLPLTRSHCCFDQVSAHHA
jgi:hypothetical protein